MLEGRSGCVCIEASDNVHVAKVRVTINDVEGNTLEEGDARRTFGNAWWEFETNTDGTIRVDVWTWQGTLPSRKRDQRECTGEPPPGA